MQFMSKGGRTAAPNTQVNAAAGHPHVQHPGGRRKHVDWVARTVRFELFIVVVGSALLLAAVALWIGTGNYKSAEAKEVNTAQYQAVFLANGQVYFGKLTDVNNKFMVLNDVFYIENQSSGDNNQNSSASTNYTLRKLGATELHAPEDKMVINQEQVTFWENLKDSGKVVTKIKEYKKNPPSASDLQGSSSSSSTPSASQSGSSATTPSTSTNSSTSNNAVKP
jgi:hypothetical protein